MLLSKCEIGLQLKKVAAQKIALEYISAFGGDFARIHLKIAALLAEKAVKRRSSCILLIENQTRFVYNTLEIKDYVFALANAKQI